MNPQKRAEFDEAAAGQQPSLGESSTESGLLLFCRRFLTPSFPVGNRLQDRGHRGSCAALASHGRIDDAWAHPWHRFGEPRNAFMAGYSVCIVLRQLWSHRMLQVSKNIYCMVHLHTVLSTPIKNTYEHICMHIYMIDTYT